MFPHYIDRAAGAWERVQHSKFEYAFCSVGLRKSKSTLKNSVDFFCIIDSFLQHHSARHKFYRIEHERAANVTFVRYIGEQNIFAARRIERVRAERHPLVGMKRLRTIR